MAKKFPMDLSRFKKVQSNPDSTILKHPDGHEIKIAHKALDPGMRSQLQDLPHFDNGTPDGTAGDSKKSFASQIAAGMNRSSMQNYEENKKIQAQKQAPQPQQASQGSVSESTGGMIPKFAEGGDVPPTETPSDAPDAPDTESAPGDFSAGPAGAPTAPDPLPSAPQSPQMATQSPQSGQAGQQPTPQADSSSFDPYGTQTSDDMLRGGISNQMQGNNAQAEAADKKSTQEAAYLGKAVEDQQVQQATYQSNLKQINDEHQALMSDIQNQHIDPNHYLGSMDTGKKVMTAIGLLLGGMGSGITGGPNPAMTYLNSQIDRDIDAQKANLGTKESLLSANMRHYGNMKDAMDATRAGMQGIVGMQLQQAAANTTGDSAKALAQVYNGKIQAESAATLGQMAARKTLLGAQSQGQVRDPYAVIQTVVPEHERGDATKELAQAQGMVKSANNINDAFNRIKLISSLSNRVANPIQSSRQIAALTDPLVAQLSKETAGRFTEQDAKFLGTLFPATGDSAETIKTKQNQIQKLITEKMNFPKLKFYGIDPTGGAGNSARYDSKFKK